MEIQHRQATIDWQQKVRDFVDAELIPWEIEAEMNQGVIPEAVAKTMQDKEYQRNFDSTNLIFFLLKYRTPLIAISVAAALLSAVVSLMIQEKYLSTVILFPAATNSISKSLMAEDFSGKQDINAFGEEEVAEQLLQILNSDDISGYIREKYNLRNHYGFDADEQYVLTNTVKEYQDLVTFKRRKQKLEKEKQNVRMVVKK